MGKTFKRKNNKKQNKKNNRKQTKRNYRKQTKKYFGGGQSDEDIKTKKQCITTFMNTILFNYDDNLPKNGEYDANKFFYKIFRNDPRFTRGISDNIRENKTRSNVEELLMEHIVNNQNVPARTIEELCKRDILESNGFSLTKEQKTNVEDRLVPIAKEFALENALKSLADEK